MTLAGPFTQKEHMSTQQPEALRLADALEYLADNSSDNWQVMDLSSDELRRLHAINAELVHRCMIGS